MKKMFIAMLLVGSSLFAGDIVGTVADIQMKADGSCLVSVKRTSDSYITTSYPFSATGDALKQMIAAALTAKSSDTPVTVNWSARTWTSIILN